MITISLIKINPITQENYNKMIKDLPFHRLSCTCGQKGSLIKHAYYKRSIKCTGELIPLIILRVKCKSCMRTHAIVPDLFVPYSRILLEDQIEIIKAYLHNKSHNPIMIKNYLIDEGNVRYIIKNLKKHWKERLSTFSISLDDKLIKLCFQHFKRQFMQIKRTSNILFS